jgi:hypothetical protein
VFDTRSAGYAVDEDGDLSQLQAELPLNGLGHGAPDAASQNGQGLPRRGHHEKSNMDPAIAQPGGDRGS